MAKINVKVKADSFPVFYAGKRYAAGSELSIEENHFNSELFEKVETVVQEAPKKTTRSKAVIADASKG